MLLCAISICILTSIFVWADADSESVVVIVIYNVILGVCAISIFVLGGIFYKKSPSVFKEKHDAFSVYSLFRYMLGKVS